MKKIILFFLLLTSLGSFVSPVQTVPYIEKLVPAVGSRAGFVLYVPEKMEAGKQYPVLFLLHGIGERGNGSMADLKKLANHINYTAAETFGEQYGFIIVEPQADLNWEHGEVEETYQWLKDSLYDRINWKKVYLSGQSLGGGGVNHYLGINPDADKLFAAAAPSAAGPNQYFLQLDKYMTNLVNTKVPYWASHNRGDKTAPPASSTLAIKDQLSSRKGTAKMWFSIFDLDGHTFPIFNRGKGNTLSDGLKYVVGNGLLINPKVNVYEWFLMNEIGKPAVAPPTLIVGPGLPGTKSPTDTAKAPPIVTPPAPSTPVYITGVSQGVTGGGVRSVTLQLLYSDGTKQQFVAPKGDRIIGTYTRNWNVKGVNVLVVTIDYEKATDITVGPTKK